MKLEQAIGEKLAWLREDRQMSQAQLGEAIGRYLGKPWTRQAVHTAEKGRRAFTAAELVAFASALDTSVPSLFLPLPGTGSVEMPSGTKISGSDYRSLAFLPSDVRGKTSAESWDGLRRIFQAVREMQGVHERLGNEIDQAFTLIGMAVEAKEVQEEAQPAGEETEE